MDINTRLAKEFNLRQEQVDNTVALIDEGATIPFIARYRKEVTGSLDDQLLRELNDRLSYMRNLEKRKEEVRTAIAEQEKMTPEIKSAISSAETLVEVEDIYRPFRPKRRTRAGIAREKGLEPLAVIIMKQENSTNPETAAADFVDAEKEIPDIKTAVQGAMDIIAEMISAEADYRMYIRNITMEEGKLTSTAKDEKAQSVYEMYYQYE
ncbi:MAG: RNA-binding transcriptional accessory protein, partial [Ruminococcus sp.]|nr:RNA-binding transcriptional accessory protein [Ruminococcus sp.]